MYEIQIPRKVQKSLQNLVLSEYERVFRSLRRLKDNPRPRQAKKLTARAGSTYRIRVGDFRILYEIDDKNRLVSIYSIARRNKVYQ